MFRSLPFPKIKHLRIPHRRYHGPPTQPSSDDTFWGICLTNVLLVQLMIHVGVYDDLIKDAKHWWKNDKSLPNTQKQAPEIK